MDLWDRRDYRYQLRSKLSPAERAAVTTYRLTEANLLTGDDRLRALTRLDAFAHNI